MAWYSSCATVKASATLLAASSLGPMRRIRSSSTAPRVSNDQPTTEPTIGIGSRQRVLPISTNAVLYPWMRAPEGVGELFGQFFDGSGARSDQRTEDEAYRSTRL
jgi:hypothetical protein